MPFDLLVLSAAVLLNGRTVVAKAGTPCQSVSSMSVAFMSQYPSATRALVPAQTAADCLKSVEIDKDEDLALIDEMKLYINWQSNLAYLREPPKDYTEERIDVIDEIDKIRKNVEDNKYNDEYTLMYDLSTTLSHTYDFHLGFRPDIRGVFTFRRGNVGRGLQDEFAIVSVSKDGKEVPKLYNYYDIIVSAEEKWTPSPISEINNQTAEDYVQNWSKNFEFHEDHARYNQLFPNQATISQYGFGSQFGRSNIPDGDYTTVKYENGSVVTYINTAMISKGAFENVEDDRTFAATFLNQGPPPSNAKRDLEKRAEPSATGFPTPEILHPEGSIGGYYLGGSGYDDVAVLSVPSFGPETDSGPEQFQNLIGTFLNDATNAGKKKLVIDLRGNTGGLVFLGYDMFKQLFPAMDPYGASTFRANEAFDITGQFMTLYLQNVTYEDAVADFNTNGAEGKLAFLWQSIFNYKLPITIENKNFTSWEEYFGPETRNGDNFTVPSRKDLNNVFADDLTLDVTGYRDRADKLNKKQPFDPKDIVMLQDGACGSTCAVFAEFMKTQGGVQQVVVGGKPETGPMQGVAGSKGSQVWPWSQVQDQAVKVYNNMPDYQEKLNETELGQLAFAARPLMRSTWQNSQQTTSGINLRDNIRMNDSSVTPLEFVYEAADCRLFYTADMVRDTTNVWKKTVDAHWGDASKTCVEGSTGHKSSLSGGAATQGGKAKSAAPHMGASGAMMAAVVGLAGMLLML